MAKLCSRSLNLPDTNIYVFTASETLHDEHSKDGDASSMKLRTEGN